MDDSDLDALIDAGTAALGIPMRPAWRQGVPHDPARMPGGSSGGSGSAIGGALVPLALGSDTNGSIRVPASFCDVFGLKPTFGRLTRAGSFPFVSSLGHLGPLARCVTDLAVAYDAMQDHDPNDPVCVDSPAEPVVPVLDSGITGLRIAADGYFRAGASPEALAALDTVAAALGGSRDHSGRTARPQRRLCHHHDRGRRAAPASAAHPAE